MGHPAPARCWVSQGRVLGRVPPTSLGPRRLLNALPANRLTATALDAFLNVSGFKLYSLYGRQFVKLLHFINDDFLVQLNEVRRVRAFLSACVCVTTFRLMRH